LGQDAEQELLGRRRFDVGADGEEAEVLADAAQWEGPPPRGVADRDGPDAVICYEPARPPQAIRSRRMSEPEPVVREVLKFESLPAQQRGSRRAVVRWSDGRVSEALRS